MVARSFEEAERTDDIRFDERGGAIDRAIDMTLGGEIHYGVRPVTCKKRRNKFAVSDITPDKDVLLVALKRRQRLQIASVCQFVQVDDSVSGGDGLEDEIGANESGAARDKKCFHSVLFISGAQWAARFSIAPVRLSRQRWPTGLDTIVVGGQV